MKSDVVVDLMFDGYRCVVIYNHNDDPKIELLPSFIQDTCRWYCGYVSIPKSSSFYGVDISDLDNEDLWRLDVHGGITFADNLKLDDGSNDFFLGFDCAHYGDNPNVQDKDFVLSECKRLVDQLKGE